MTQGFGERYPHGSFQQRYAPNRVCPVCGKEAASLYRDLYKKVWVYKHWVRVRGARQTIYHEVIA